MIEIPTQDEQSAQAIITDRLVASLDLTEAQWDDPEAPVAVGYLTNKLAELDKPPEDVLRKYLSILHRNGLRKDDQRDYPAYTVLYLTDLPASTLQSMEAHQGTAEILETILGNAFHMARADGSADHMSRVVRVTKPALGVDSIVSPEAQAKEKKIVHDVINALQSGEYSLASFYNAEMGSMAFKTEEQRRRADRHWMADTIAATEGISPEQADDLTYSMAMSVIGHWKLDTFRATVDTFGIDRLELLAEKTGIHEIGLYSLEQLERMYAVASNDKEEIDRLRQHDVVAVFIAREGDHSGISNDAAEKLDDDEGRTLFYEVNHPKQIYTFMKHLHGMGIDPSTIVFASHGSPGQFIIEQKSPLDEEGAGVMHVISIQEQNFLNTRSTDSMRGYSIGDAHGFARAIQRFMQPSRGIDDPEEDTGRKKIISLSCGFDGDSNLATRDDNGEYIVGGGRTTVLKELGAFVARKLPNEHVDIYGARISTNSQTRTKNGIHYNTLFMGKHHPYPASVIHIDEGETMWHRQNEIRLRK